MENLFLLSNVSDWEQLALDFKRIHFYKVSWHSDITKWSPFASEATVISCAARSGFTQATCFSGGEVYIGLSVQPGKTQEPLLGTSICHFLTTVFSLSATANTTIICAKIQTSRLDSKDLSADICSPMHWDSYAQGSRILSRQSEKIQDSHKGSETHHEQLLHDTAVGHAKKASK